MTWDIKYIIIECKPKGMNSYYKFKESKCGTEKYG